MLTKNPNRKHNEKTERMFELELMRLRQRLWRARGRRSRIAGAALLLVSGFFLILAYITRYIVFEVISILALLLGVVFVFTSTESYVKTKVANRAVVSLLIPLASILKHMKVKGKAAYIPSASEKYSQKIFLPTDSAGLLPTFEEIMKENGVAILDKGILLPPIGNALLQLYEEELGDLRNFDLEYLMAWLPRALVDGLRIAEKVEITQKMDEIYVKITDSAFGYVCQQPSAKVICEVIGCPICSSFGEALSKNTSRIVYYLKCEHDPLKRKTKVFYTLGPTLETLKHKKETEESSGSKS